MSLPDGQHATREYVIHPGAVMIVAQLDDGRLVLERQYRYPLQRVMIEFPAGKLDVGETSLACAQRELSDHAAALALQLAEQKLAQEMTAADHTRLVDRYVAQVKER